MIVSRQKCKLFIYFHKAMIT